VHLALRLKYRARRFDCSFDHDLVPSRLSFDFDSAPPTFPPSLDWDWHRQRKFFLCLRVGEEKDRWDINTSTQSNWNARVTSRVNVARSAGGMGTEWDWGPGRGIMSYIVC